MSNSEQSRLDRLEALAETILVGLQQTREGLEDTRVIANSNAKSFQALSEEWRQDRKESQKDDVVLNKQGLKNKLFSPWTLILIPILVFSGIWLCWPKIHSYWYERIASERIVENTPSNSKQVPTTRADKIGEYAQFGDSFGSLNALFSGLAFAGVIAALFLQREELKKLTDANDAEISREKKEFCFRMFEVWSSSFMRDCRTSVWVYIAEHSNGKAFNFAILKQEKTDLWRKVNAIQHFMCDLNIMLKQDVIDRMLAVRLFKSVMDDWLEYFLDVGSDWGAEKIFIEKEVAPLRSTLETLSRLCQR